MRITKILEKSQMQKLKSIFAMCETFVVKYLLNSDLSNIKKVWVLTNAEHRMLMPFKTNIISPSSKQVSHQKMKLIEKMAMIQLLCLWM